MAGQKGRQSTKLLNVSLTNFVLLASVMKASIGSLQKLSRNVMKCNFILFNISHHIHIRLYIYLILVFFRLKKFVIVEPQSADYESGTTRISVGELRNFEMAKGMTPSVFVCVNVSGPLHNSIFTMTCKQGDHITSGNYFIIIILFLGKIMNCFFLFYRSRKVQANRQKYRSFSHVEDSL